LTHNGQHCAISQKKAQFSLNFQTKFLSSLWHIYHYRSNVEYVCRVDSFLFVPVPRRWFRRLGVSRSSLRGADLRHTGPSV
jgi:hypothetical protein